MYGGFFRYGETEIVNNPRTLGLARTARCPAGWFTDHDEVPGLRAWLGEDEYVWSPYSTPAPWADPDVDNGANDFLGVYGSEIRGLSDSTFEANSIQAAGKGGIIGRGREATRQVRFRVVIAAMNERGAEYGVRWLTRILRGKGCSTHGSACGAASLSWLEDRPMDAVTGGEQVRFLHDVKLVVPPTVEKDLYGPRVEGFDEDGKGIITQARARIVSFIVEAENPTIYAPMEVNPTLDLQRSFISDAPINYMPYPSAELTGPDVVVMRNISQNPSIEVDASRMTGAIMALSGSDPAARFSSGQTVDGGAPYGLRTFRGRFQGISSGTKVSGRARMTLSQLVDLTDFDAYSFSIWARLAEARGTGFSVSTFRTYAQFLNAANASVGDPAIIYAAPSGSAALAALTGAGIATGRASVPRPAGATKVRVAAELAFNWSSGSGVATPTQVQLLTDGFGVMVP